MQTIQAVVTNVYKHVTLLFDRRNVSLYENDNLLIQLVTYLQISWHSRTASLHTSWMWFCNSY